MKWQLFALAGASFFAAEAAAPAQMPTPGRPSPTFSPYLNFLRPGSRTLNYFGLVRPEQEFRQSIGQLQQGLTATNQQLTTGLNATAEPTTGHTARFMTHYRYFQTNGSGQTAGVSGGRPSVPTMNATAGANRPTSYTPPAGRGGPR